MDGVDVLATAKERFRHCQDYESENRRDAVEDLHFVDGDQWPDQIKSEREKDNRPCLTINRIPHFVRQVVNDIRQIRPAIKARPVDSNGDPETAEMINGMIRAIEQESSAESAYDWAAEYAIEMGWGYWRINIDYVDGESFDQCLKIERIRNPFSVYIDPAAQNQDGSDMRYAFVVENMSKSAFESKYPGKESSSDGFAWTSTEDQNWWYGEDTVRVAEYWEVKEEFYTLILATNPLTGEQDRFIGEIPEGFEEVARRKASKKSIISRIMTGREVLEETPYVGEYVPIVRVLGREKDIEGEVKLKGMVRDLQDPQRQYNYFRSASTERVALYAKAPYIGPKGAFKSPKWRSANTKSYPFLEYDGDVPPQRQPPPDISPGFANEVMTTAEELKAITGIYDAGIGNRSNEISGVAIDSRKLESDVSNFDFVDNLARAMTYSGKILVDLIPKVYSGPRIVRTLSQSGEDEMVKLNEPYIDGQQRNRQYMLEVGKYDVSVDVGPSYTSQRQEASKSMMEVLKHFPQAAEVVGDLMVKNFDWPGADEISKRLKTLLPPELLKNESPAVAQMMRQKDMELQQLGQQMQMVLQQNQALMQELQNKQGELAVKEEDVRRKIAKDLMDHREGMTDLEIKANKDLGQYGVYL